MEVVVETTGTDYIADLSWQEIWKYGLVTHFPSAEEYKTLPRGRSEDNGYLEWFKRTTPDNMTETQDRQTETLDRQTKTEERGVSKSVDAFRTDNCFGNIETHVRDLSIQIGELARTLRDISDIVDRLSDSVRG